MAASPGALDLEFLPLQPQARLGTANPKTASILKLSGRAAYTSGRGAAWGQTGQHLLAVSFSQSEPSWMEPATRQPMLQGSLTPLPKCPLQPVRCSLGLDAGLKTTRLHRPARRRVGRVDERDGRRCAAARGARDFIAPVEESLRWHPDLSRPANLSRPSFPTSKLSSRT